MKLLRIGICALVAFAVLAHGAVEDWAKAVLETSAGLLFLFWSVQFYRAYDDDHKIVLTPLLPPLILLAVVALAQLLLHATASAYDTRMDLTLLLAYAILLFLATQAFRYSDDWRGFIWFIMIFGFLVAIFGIHVHRSVHGYFQLLVPVVSHRIQREVGGNAEKPGGELCARHIVFARQVDAQEHFLRKVFSLLPVANHPVQKVNQRRAIALQQKLERGLVASLHIQHQLDVGSSHSRHTVTNTFVL